MLAVPHPHTVLPLWPGPAPLAAGTESADIPTLTVHLPPAEMATGAGVVICPGGGYRNLAGHEGGAVAAWFNARGVAGLVLTYRLGPRYHHPAQMWDVQRALRLARTYAEAWGLAPGALGVMGFSAGGHLATTAATHFDDGNPAADDPVERASCRPDFLIAIYPVVNLEPPYAHMGSRLHLLGDSPDHATVAGLCNASQVNSDTPPTFLVHTWEDTAVPPENSVEFYLALRAAGVRAEMHLYEGGQHGFGLAIDRPGPDWTPALATWMRAHGWMRDTVCAAHGRGAGGGLMCSLRTWRRQCRSWLGNRTSR